MSHEYSVIIIYKQKRLGVFKSIWVKAIMPKVHANFENSNQEFWLKNRKMADHNFLTSTPILKAWLLLLKPMNLLTYA